MVSLLFYLLPSSLRLCTLYSLGISYQDSDVSRASVPAWLHVSAACLLLQGL
eukprot:COSAG06_NODE_611_length_13818_cov_9.629346_3_plen_52_part_00